MNWFQLAINNLSAIDVFLISVFVVLPATLLAVGCFLKFVVGME